MASPLRGAAVPNLGIVSAYNDMLSAHQPYETYPDAIRGVARELGATAPGAGCVFCRRPRRRLPRGPR